MVVFHRSTSDLCHRICQMSFLAAQETVEHWCPVLHKAEDLFILEPVINWTGFAAACSDSLLGPFSSHVFLFCGLLCTFLLIRLELVQQKCSKYREISSQCRSSIFVLFSPALRQEHFVEACNGMHSGPLIFC